MSRSGPTWHRRTSTAVSGVGLSRAVATMDSSRARSGQCSYLKAEDNGSSASRPNITPAVPHIGALVSLVGLKSEMQVLGRAMVQRLSQGPPKLWCHESRILVVKRHLDLTFSFPFRCRASPWEHVRYCPGCPGRDLLPPSHGSQG